MILKEGAAMKKKSFLGRLFPPKYNFYQRLSSQAALTAQGMQSLLDWMEGRAPENKSLLFDCADRADTVRLTMEEELIDAFSTPFARQDIYFLSVRMDRVLELARTTIKVIETLEVEPDEITVDMARKLSQGVNKFSQAVAILEVDPIKAGSLISTIRQSQGTVENDYHQGLAVIFRSADPLLAMRLREVYAHLRNAAASLGNAVDILHRVVVRLA